MHTGPVGFAAFVAGSNRSRWRLGFDRPGKYGWIANELPAEQVNLEKPQRFWPLLSAYPRLDMFGDAWHHVCGKSVFNFNSTSNKET